MSVEWKTYAVNVHGEKVEIEAAVWFPTERDMTQTCVRLRPETSYRRINGFDPRCIDRANEWWDALDEALFDAESARREAYRQEMAAMR